MKKCREIVITSKTRARLKRHKYWDWCMVLIFLDHKWIIIKTISDLKIKTINYLGQNASEGDTVYP